jgi:hypothetical protein
MTQAREELCEVHGPDLLFLDGPEFDQAILGVAERPGGLCAVAYDVQRVLGILEQDMSSEEALEYFEFNISCAWVGEHTPIFIDTQWR